MTDFEAYARRLRIQYIFRDKAPLPHDPFRQKSNRPFTSCSNAALEHYISETRRDLSSVRHGKKTDNLTLEEKKSLARLKLRKDIVVKKADKGNCVTVESRVTQVAYLLIASAFASDAHFRHVQRGSAGNSMDCNSRRSAKQLEGSSNVRRDRLILCDVLGDSRCGESFTFRCPVDRGR